MRKTLTTAVTTTAFAAAGLAGLTAPLPSLAASKTLPACIYEDGSGQTGACVWDGKHMGNGEGRSYIVKADGRVVPISHRRAHRLAAH